jgi:hypothetical protein
MPRGRDTRPPARHYLPEIHLPSATFGALQWQSTVVMLPRMRFDEQGWFTIQSFN